MVVMASCLLIYIYVHTKTGVTSFHCGSDEDYDSMTSSRLPLSADAYSWLTAILDPSNSPSLQPPSLSKSGQIQQGGAVTSRLLSAVT